MSDKTETYVIRWPFKLIELEPLPFCNITGDNDLNATSPIWQCGWHQDNGHYENVCWHDAEGWMTLKVVSRHKPTPNHMERCFLYKRIFNPFGQPFNKTSFHCITQGRLESYINGHVVSHSELSGDISERYDDIEPFISHSEDLLQAMSDKALTQNRIALSTFRD